MPNMTLSIPEELHKKMKRHTELKWSDIIRQAFEKKLNEVDVLEKVLNRSEFSEEDAERTRPSDQVQGEQKVHPPMRLIVDTSRIIAAMIKDSASRAILLSDKFEFLTVNFAKIEIEEHKQEIMEKAKISEDELNLVLSIFLSHVVVECRQATKFLDWLEINM